MNFELLIALAGLVSYLIVGLCVLSICGLKIEFPAKAALAFGIGAGMVSFVLFAYSLIGIPINFPTVILPWLVLFMYILGKGKVFKMSKNDEEDFIPIDYFFILLTIITVLIAILYTLSSPVTAFDSVATWSMLAKYFFFERSLGGELYIFLNIDNPPLVSLQQSFLSILMGTYNDKEALLLFPTYYIWLMTLFYYLVKRVSTRTNALIFTFFLASTPMILGQAGRLSVGYVDIVLSYFILASLFMMYFLLRDVKPGYVFLLGFILASLALTKNEGMGIALISIIIMLIILKNNNNLRYLFYFVAGLLPFFVFRLYSAVEDYPSHYLYSGYPILARIPEIAKKFVLEVFALSRWNFLWISFIVSLFFLRSSIFIRIVLLVLVFQLFVYSSIYIVTPIDLTGHIDASLDRFLLQVSPLALLVVSSVFSKPKINEK